MYTVDSNMIGLHAVPIVNLPSRKLAGKHEISFVSCGQDRACPSGITIRIIRTTTPQNRVFLTRFSCRHHHNSLLTVFYRIRNDEGQRGKTGDEFSTLRGAPSPIRGGYSAVRRFPNQARPAGAPTGKPSPVSSPLFALFVVYLHRYSFLSS